jgi:ABC-type transporter Mla subunit MlaD
VDPFRLGMPKIPGLSELLAVLQAQTEALAQLPRTLTDLNSAVRELITATATATAAISSAQRTAERLEGLVGELEEPVRALRPGLERVGRVLDDPAVDAVPDIIRAIDEDLVPVLATIRQAQTRVLGVTGLLRRRGGGGEEPS